VSAKIMINNKNT